jgi:hypothetical protein
MSQEQSDITFVWWVPEQYWQAGFAESPQMNQAQADEFLKAIRPYTLVITVSGTRGLFGSMTYRSEGEIRSSMKLKDANGKTYAPLGDDAVDADVKTLMQMIRPIISNILGPMGQNMQLVLFQARTDDGKPIADAARKGSSSIFLAEKEFKWRLPLDSVFAGTPLRE